MSPLRVQAYLGTSGRNLEVKEEWMQGYREDSGDFPMKKTHSKGQSHLIYEAKGSEAWEEWQV